MKKENWDLRIAYSASCCHCLCNEEVIKETQEEAISCLLGIGWEIRNCGPWCPECVPLLGFGTREQRRTLTVGTLVRERMDVLGTIKEIGDGYAILLLPDGYTKPYPLTVLHAA